MRLRDRKLLPWATGLLGVLAYAWSIRPLDPSRPGYIEDICVADLARQLLAQNLEKSGRPAFFSESVMAPAGGAPVPFLYGGFEKDWLGAYAFLLSPTFPFHYVLLIASLVASYLGVGWILRRMRFGSWAAWGLAAFFVSFHLPRQFKAYHHFDHTPQHWVYWAVFLDAWIWSRLWRERRWSLTLEAWRGFLMLGMLGIAGYYWGPLILEWMVVRGFMLGLVLWRKRRGEEAVIRDGSWRRTLVPVGLGLIWLVPVLRWYLPFAEEVRRFGEMYQPLGYFTHLTRIIQPLWLEKLWVPVHWVWPALPRISPIDSPETVVTVGWLYWVPAVLGLLWVRRRHGGLGVLTVAPFALVLTLACLYAIQLPPALPELMRSTLPFMQFFRTASRMGLILPQLLAAIIVLAWPELQAGARRLWAQSPRMRRWAPVLALLAALELSWILAPTNSMPPLDPTARELLAAVKATPGDRVLDLPFCVNGGNGVCGHQCPNYPASNVGQCLSFYHGKKVYGLYQGRMSPALCTTFDQPPYPAWFGAWREQRCFTPSEWDGFCGHLESQPGLAAVLFYTNIWHGANTPECRAEFERRLGPPLQKAEFWNRWHTGKERGRSGLIRYGARCITGS